MKKLLKMFTAAAAVVLLSVSMVNVYATSVLSPLKSVTVNGITYSFTSQLISSDMYMAANVGIKPTNVREIPAGYAYAQGRLYNAAGAMVDFSSWKVNGESTSLFTHGIIVPSNKLVPGWGQCHSKGQVKFYTGNGYCDPICCYSSPDLPIPQTLSDDIPLVDVTRNEYGEIYGSEIFLEQLGVTPDLILALGSNGEIGYVRAEDIDACDFNTPDEAIAYSSTFHEYSVPLYESDGRTVIGSVVSSEAYASASDSF